MAVPVDDRPIADPAVRALVDSGQVLLLCTTNLEREFLWPLVRDETGLPRPVPGLATVIALVETGRARRQGGSASTMPPAAIAEFLLVEHDDPTVEMPVRIAHQAGLVGDAEHDRIVEAARNSTSLAQEIADGTAEPALTWLVKQFLWKYRAILRDDRMTEWQRGLDNNRHRPQWQGTDS